MRCIIFGLGNFGSTLCKTLTIMGHEVVGVDKKMDKVELHKEYITHTVCLDSTDKQAINTLPIDDADIVMVTIGEDEGASILTTALAKQMKAKRIIVRVLSPVQKAVMEAMDVKEFIMPEQDSAERLARNLDFTGIINNIEITDEYSVVEVIVPKKYEGMALKEIPIHKKYGINILAIIEYDKESNNPFEENITGERKHIRNILSADEKIQKDTHLLLFGNTSQIKKMLESTTE
ncbi:MAG: TrkA family potassium uptake protein [Chitinophagaceae bacterium]|nr:TrkA family potassium uptake protein [Chitinophagaceae bacterium]